MTRIIANRMFQTSIATTLDQIMFGLYLPGHTKVRGVNGYVNLEGTTLKVAQKVVAAGVQGWIVPVPDPDGSVTMTDLWDRYVPKDTGANSMDLDTIGLDTDSMYEAGEFAWEDMIPIGYQPKRVFDWHGMFGLGNHNLYVGMDNESPFGVEYIPGRQVRIQVKPFHTVDQPSVLLFAAGSPGIGNTSPSTPIGPMIEAHWMQLRYFDHVLERAMLSVMGVVEAGAETPWAEAADIIRNHIIPQVLETTADTFEPTTWLAYGEARIDFEVEGTLKKTVITGGERAGAA